MMDSAFKRILMILALNFPRKGLIQTNLKVERLMKKLNILKMRNILLKKEPLGSVSRNCGSILDLGGSCLSLIWTQETVSLDLGLIIHWRVIPKGL